GSYDIFLIKYNSNGVKQWTKQWGTSSYEHGSGVVVDTGGNIYVTGYTWGGLDGNTNFGYSISTSDTFLTKYDSNGTKQWTKQWGTDHGDYGAGLAVDTGGNIYIAGYIQLFQPAFYDRSIVPIDTDLFLVKYDSSGINQWAKYPRKSTSDECGTGVAVDTGGNIYLIGNTDGSLDGNTNAGSEDVFLVKYDSSGNKIWTKQFGTASDDRGRGVANDSYGNIYITGCTAGGLDGNTNAGSYDIFLTKYVPSSGTILGKVTKSDGITVIPQTLVETLQSGVVKSITTTDTNGNYSITAAIGTYDVHALASGYATKQVTGIVVIENSTTTVNFILLSTTPALLVNLTSLNFDKIVKGQSTTLTFTITNTECGTLIGNIAANKPWISASPASFSLSTGTSQNISVTVSPTRDLPDNVTYTGAVSITSNGGQGTVSISVIPTCAITYPEPISLSSGKVLTFWGTGVSYGTIRIYTLTGELVKELRETNGNDKITWDLTNEQGEKVVRGIYFYTASNPKEPKGNRGKITVTK
ncbi:MAG TPA: hypothetical protein DHV62_09325, partial [Elusimicrobia bacterium]|nr:hypothetical protein [Elusimicrobiota bacterium]